MNLDQTYYYTLWFIFGFSVFTFFGSFFYITPYGRFKKPDEKFVIESRLGWLIMESPCLLACATTFFASGGHSQALVPLVFLGIWQTHYFYRAIIFPLRMRDRGKPMPVAAVATGVIFNTINGFLNGYAFTHSAHLLDSAWLTAPWFVIGVITMIVGVSININSDNILRNLRAPGETGYRIPRGGLYRWISVPNYFGEIVEWTGLAIAAHTPATLSFALFTTANLLPRALAHHKWYKEKFADYPADRKAVIPFIL